MPMRINQAIARLEQDQAIYYVGEHCGHVLTFEQGKADARTWADYINVGMEHGAFDLTGLAHYMRGLGEGGPTDGGPTDGGHRMPAVIVEAPVNGIDEAHVRFNAWQFRQILAQGAHGILLCQAEQPAAVRAFVESCRYPHQTQGLDPALPTPLERLRAPAGEVRGAPVAKQFLGRGTRGRGSEATVAAVWDVSPADVLRLADVWPLNPEGELLLGVKIESPEGVANCDEILAVPGLGFAEIGPGDLGLSLGYTTVRNDPYPPEMQEARDRIFAACRRNRLAFLEMCTPENIRARIDEGVRIVAGHREETARVGRAHQQARRGRPPA
jgi:4-hydroxy-2-oxoheptanedioate aldolase